MPTEGNVSVEVSMMMPSATLPPLLPMVKPLIVMLNTDDWMMEAPEMVTITAVTDVVLHVAARPETLLAPAATVGVMFGLIKLEG
jgi:hypothetical protein